ncbi:MAG: DNA polymerase III subunit beta [candidate division WOR-3 bacterium]
MRCVLDREIFAEALGTVVGVLPSRTTYPVFQNILLEIFNGRLAVTGTDGDTVVRKELKIEGESEDGRTLVEGRRLWELVQTSQGGEVSLRSDEKMLKFESGRLKAALVQLAPEEFPELPKMPDEVSFEFPLATLFEMFETVSFAASKDESRPVMTAVNWEVGKSEVRMVATDGYRLVYVTRKLKVGAKTKLLLTPKAVAILPKGEEKVLVFSDPKMVGFKLEDTTVISRMIEGPYPDYERVIPKGYGNRAVVGVGEFTQVLRRATILANPIAKQISLEFKPNGLTVRAENVDVGKSEEELDCQYQGEVLRVGFNGGYLLEILRHINSEEMVIELSSPMAPVLFKPTDTKADAEDLFVLMPLRLD